MTSFATSADGTRIAYDIEGEGPAVILVAGAFQFRAFDPETRELASLLAARGFTVLNYDRRGRGESGGSAPFTLAQTLEDLAALIEAAGGSAALFGSSSGGSISLAAAAAGLPVTALALWEVPLGPQPDGGEREAFLAELRKLIRDGETDAVVEHFMKDMPPEWLEGSKASPAWPTMVQVGPSLEPDTESLAVAQSAPRRELWGGISVPVAALVGAETLAFFGPAADSIVEAIPGARRIEVPGADHRWDRDALLDILSGFLSGRDAHSGVR
ncbi:alpha/beta fold hydrolase [Naasia aerilata]|uniref:Alpha/beta hydrolase n=1 Tax=Naasia aerilata TaxID=1162966 RepID=A0ABM8GA54_9MICO|nr:alpha/beta hydrolase [Naasia aerilata]BDZ45073.1 alpha/beta hydrolase [Naasia aerilata]